MSLPPLLHQRLQPLNKSLLSCVFLFSLAACDAAQNNSAIDTQPAVEVPVRTSETIQPGAKSISIERAVSVFQQACVANLPNFVGTPSTADSLGLIYNTRNKSFYHPTENLSVKLIGGECSIVFSASANGQSVNSAFDAARAQAAGISEGRRTSAHGTTYYNFRISKR